MGSGAGAGDTVDFGTIQEEDTYSFSAGNALIGTTTINISTS